MFNNSTGFTMPVMPYAYGGNSGGGFGGFGDGWIGLIIILALLGWGGNGGGAFGGFGGFGGRDCGCGCATQADVRNAVDQQTLISKLDQQTYGLADSTYALNNGITTGFAGVQQTLCQGFNGINVGMLQGFNGLQAQIAGCCCDTQRAIDGINYNMATQACDIKHAINDSTRSILDFLVNDKLSTLQAENQNLRLRASQADQNAVLRAAIDASTAEIIRRTGNDCPVPAYVVQPPTQVSFPTNCCGSFTGYGGGSGCGCGF